QAVRRLRRQVRLPRLPRSSEEGRWTVRHGRRSREVVNAGPAAGAVLRDGAGERTATVRWKGTPIMGTLTHDDCIDGPERCGGKTEYRMALSASGKCFARCDAHWEARLDEQERINRDYPDSAAAPSWFDASYAGEVWSEDDY